MTLKGVEIHRLRVAGLEPKSDVWRTHNPEVRTMVMSVNIIDA